MSALDVPLKFSCSSLPLSTLLPAAINRISNGRALFDHSPQFTNAGLVSLRRYHGRNFGLMDSIKEMRKKWRGHQINSFRMVYAELNT